MKSRDILVNDLLTYVAQHHGEEAFVAVDEVLPELKDTITQVLWIDPVPEGGLTKEYRKNFIEAFNSNFTP
jgi:hypothetical protein